MAVFVIEISYWNGKDDRVSIGKVFYKEEKAAEFCKIENSKYTSEYAGRYDYVETTIE